MSEKDKCPKCGRGMLLFRSLRYKQYVTLDCGIKVPWDLDKGQKPLILAQR